MGKILCLYYTTTFEKNQETFVKNIFLLLMAAVVCFNTSLYRRCISSSSRWAAVIFILIYTVLVEGMSLQHLPVIDFRPFAIGTDLREAVEDIPSQYEAVAVYEKGGTRREFATDALPDSTWSYIGSRNRLVAPARPAAVSNFLFIDLATDYDIAEDILADPGYVALLVIESVESADESRVDKINDLYDYCKEHELPFYAATSSSEDAVALWRKRTGAEYPIYWADNDMLKTAVRANPGLLLLKDGVVVEKWNIADVPAVDTMSGSSLSLLQEGLFDNYVKVMRGWRFWLLLFAIPMALILFIDMFAAPKKRDSEAAFPSDDKENE